MSPNWYDFVKLRGGYDIIIQKCGRSHFNSLREKASLEVCLQSKHSPRIRNSSIIGAKHTNSICAYDWHVHS